MEEFVGRTASLVTSQYSFLTDASWTFDEAEPIEARASIPSWTVLARPPSTRRSFLALVDFDTGGVSGWSFGDLVAAITLAGIATNHVDTPSIQTNIRHGGALVDVDTGDLCAIADTLETFGARGLQQAAARAGQEVLSEVLDTLTVVLGDATELVTSNTSTGSFVVAGLVLAHVSVDDLAGFQLRVERDCSGWADAVVTSDGIDTLSVSRTWIRHCALVDVCENKNLGHPLRYLQVIKTGRGQVNSVISLSEVAQVIIVRG